MCGVNSKRLGRIYSYTVTSDLKEMTLQCHHDIENRNIRLYSTKMEIILIVKYPKCYVGAGMRRGTDLNAVVY